MLKKPLRAEVLIRVPFYDVDQMRYVWHGNYIKYFERARCELLDKIDYGYKAMEASGYMWPIIDMRLKYVKPGFFDHSLKVCAELQEYENRLKIAYEIFDQQSGERLTKGYTLQVAVAIESGEMCYVSPAILQERLQCHGYL
jgi:acyl-CoA thioester hydrolase